MSTTRGTMRRIVTTAVAVALMGGALAAPAVATDDSRPGRPEAGSAQAWTVPGEQTARGALATARRLARGNALPRDPDMTMALRDLWRRKSELRGNDRQAAGALLARPS